VSHLYEALANLLEYPGYDWKQRLAACQQSLTVEQPELRPLYEEFCQRIDDFTLFALQELYTQTFDLNPVCALEVGRHLFGEDYRRGFFLARLRETESPYALGQAQQLPDYLPVLLRLLSKLGDDELRHDLTVIVGSRIRKFWSRVVRELRTSACGWRMQSSRWSERSVRTFLSRSSSSISWTTWRRSWKQPISCRRQKASRCRKQRS
jgi:nitrate reductase assembly molybdenum cofactor insertion protein NarJ